GHGGPVGPMWLRIAVFAAGTIVGWLLSHPVNYVLGLLFRGFNWVFDVTIKGYGGIVALALRLCVIVLIVYGGLIGLTYFALTTTPVGFIPDQDKGYLVANVQLPDGANLDRSDALIRKLSEEARAIEGVAHTLDLPGYSTILSTNISNVGGMFIILSPFEERAGKPELSASAIIQKLMQKFSQHQDAQVAVFGAPPVEGLGSTGGFKLQVEDRRGAGLRELQGAVQNLAEVGSNDPRIARLLATFSVSQPQLFVEIDREKVKAQGVSLDEIHATLQTYLGSAYVNDFSFQNRNWQVNVQAAPDFRMRPEDIGRLEVRTASGERVQLRTLIDVKDTSGPPIVNRYKLYPSAEVTGATIPGVSSGQAVALMDELATRELPSTMGFEWTELTYQQILAGQDVLTKLVFPLAVVFVLLVLAAQYESWSLPVAIILIVPMCILAAMCGVMLAKLDNNIFVQIGLVVLVGLAAKNAILIVEFAKQLEDQGRPRFEATVEASKLRLRPILMTSFAFILGVVPLVLAKGAGAEMRSTLGIAVFSGMLGVTIFGVFFTPVFYYVIRWLTARRQSEPAAASPVPMDVPHHETGDGNGKPHVAPAAVPQS
ncbi:MAG: efflux RND transporter permease subunit, partial [Planctomycetaceae bacterium]|nr:efflux RND transporter permease subunit [Planctomycetaceae bacterium]